ncbi:MAG: hypothetical protein DRQ39_06290, partial [Gammaproteobacteria bacterium]
RAYDITLSDDYMITSLNYDATIRTDVKWTTGVDFNIVSGSDYRQTALGTTNITGVGGLYEMSGGNIAVNAVGEYREQAAVIFMNSGPGLMAALADQADIPELPTLPILPDPPIVAELTTVWDDLTCVMVPPDCCIDPPLIDFLGKIVPQHFPWPEATIGRVDLHSGTVTANDERSDAVILIREGATEAGAEAPLSGVLVLDGQPPAVVEGKPYETDSPDEEPAYDIINPDASACTAPAASYDGVSEEMREFIKTEEGYREKPYRDGDKWAVGYGHNINIGDTINGETVTAADIAALNKSNGDSMRIDNKEANRLLDEDIKKVTDSIDKTVEQPITQGQYDALTSFGYNVGTDAMEDSTMMKRLNEGKFDQVPKEYMRWTKANGKENPTLRRRRKKELNGFFNKIPAECAG